jgi:uncharacterized membrane protein
MLVAFPITFYTVSFLSFVWYQMNPVDVFWLRVGHLSGLAGVLTAVLAAIPGMLDWALGIPRDTAAKRTGLVHAGLNVGVLILFALNSYLWAGVGATPVPDVTSAVILTSAGFLLTLGGGFYGWEMIGIHKVGVELDPEAQRIEDSREHRAARKSA